MAQIFHLFDVFGIELEYMIVCRENLSVFPISDQLIKKVAGEFLTEVEVDEIAWTNELVLHVIELKTNGPAKQLEPLTHFFHKNIKRINTILLEFNAQLLSTAAHPFMDPDVEAKLWPHGDKTIYETYNKIFNCQGHGWSNLQSMHINLPFANDEEFFKLHSAIRLLLPLMPALAASTPILEGKITDFVCSRMNFYIKNQERIPAITGKLIPEVVRSRKEYEEKILNPMYDAIRPYDPEGILADEWLNSRGAIARFDRNAIEIRVLDVQESPKADIAICGLITTVLKSLVNQQWINIKEQCELTEEQLLEIFLEIIKSGQATPIKNSHYLKCFGYTKKSTCTAGELWEHLFHQVMEKLDPSWLEPLQIILKEGNLAERIIKRLGNQFTREEIMSVYRELANCLAENQLFRI
ncbi:MAG: glutamate--cysteine ligase [Proteobacteria bacterium]|nr:glutamate--cysteine ligase [Pseudomonadota bacterium]